MPEKPKVVHDIIKRTIFMDDVIEAINIPLWQPIDLLVISVKTTAMRCKIVSTDQPITLRKVRDEVEGEILTVIPSKIWRYKGLLLNKSS